MCGILGISGTEKASIQEAAALFKYRGPDAFGIYADKRITLGHNRLAIIDLDPRATQPLFDTHGDVGVVFNGEIYNYKTLRIILEKESDYKFKTQSDTEVLVASYLYWGRDFLTHIKGMFALAIYDRRTSMILLATDHANIKPLFYSNIGGLFVFASELKGVIKLLRNKNISLETNNEALKLYWAFGYVPAPNTLYTSVYRIPKSSWVQYNLDTNIISSGTYKSEKYLSSGEAMVMKSIEEAVKSHTVADVPVGVFFSGGTDSSLITSILHSANINLKTFSLRIVGRNGDSPFFVKIAERLGLETNIYDFGVDEFDQSYQELMLRIDDPLTDNSIFPTYFLSKKAAKKVKVVLSGEGGDEYFGGYLRSVVLKHFPNVLDTNISIFEWVYLFSPQFHMKNIIFSKLFIATRRPIAYYLLTLSPAKSLMTIESWIAAKKEIVQQKIAPENFDSELYLPNDLLRKTDIATMYCSIEGRVPLLDEKVITVAQNTPQIVTSRRLKPILKNILEHFLPSELVERSKSGFGLEPRELYPKSKYVKLDLNLALNYLSAKKLLIVRRLPSTEKLLTRNPQFCLQIIMLYHSLRNNEAW